VNTKNTPDSFCDSTYENEMHLAEAELSAFIGAVTELFGPAQARLAAEDWLDESDLMDSPPRSTSRDWRAVTVAASARLADRLAPHRISERPVLKAPSALVVRLRSSA
jgi:hypothetical protein